MKIRDKTLIVFSISLILLIVLLSVFISFFIIDESIRLEQQEVKNDLVMVGNILDAEIDHVDVLARDWASWNDTYDFVESSNPDYIRQYLQDENLNIAGINFVAYFNRTGGLVYGRGYDGEKSVDMPLPPELSTSFGPAHSSIVEPAGHTGAYRADANRGFLALPEGIGVVAAYPILTNQGEGPARGSLVMGKYLTFPVLRRSGSDSDDSLVLYPYSDPAVQEIVDTFSALAPGEIVVATTPEDTIRGYSVINDIYGEPVSVLSIEEPRSISRQGLNSALYALYAIFGVGLLFGLISMVVLEGFVLRRLSSMDEAVRDIGGDGMLSRRLSITGSDELAHLGQTINLLVDKVASSKESLYTSEQRYHSILEDQTEFIARFRADGTYVFVNESYSRYFGRSPEELIGHRFTPPVPPEDRDAVARHFASLTRESPVNTIEHRFIMPDGEIRWIQWTDRAIFDSGGAIVEYQSVGRDVTDRHRAEEALCIANSKLNILGSITRHDILNLLTALQGYIEMGEEIATDKELKKDLATSDDLCNRIKKLLLFTRDYQTMGLEKPHWQDVAGCIGKVLSGIPHEGIAVRIDVNGLEVYADGLLEKVFYNLIENAIRHGERVTNVAARCLETNDDLVIVVEDDGIGVSLEDKARLFRQGYGKNTGYGLFLSREILAITGMTIEETGVPEEGARFVIHVPRGHYRFGHGERNLRGGNGRDGRDP